MQTSGRESRSVPALHALAWYAEAMRLWKRGPVAFAALAFVTLVLSIAFEPVPILGFVTANLVAPLLATGMLYASLAADRGEGPRLKHAIAAFAAPVGAQATVIVAGLVAFAAEAFSAWQLAGANLFLPNGDAANLPMGVVVAIYFSGIVASLPLTFVPFAALFDGEDLRRAFATSARGFARNVPALALYAGISPVLLLLGLATMGVGLVLVLPWMAAASYAAWKDIYGLDVPTRS
ncbi:MAG TPA: hypothetical protein VIK97_09695 [Casimicrobiaceae bacterium]